MMMLYHEGPLVLPKKTTKSKIKFVDGKKHSSMFLAIFGILKSFPVGKISYSSILEKGGVNQENMSKVIVEEHKANL